MNVFQWTEKAVPMRRKGHERVGNVAGAEPQCFRRDTFHHHDGHVQSRNLEPSEEVAFLQMMFRDTRARIRRPGHVKLVGQYGLLDSRLHGKKPVKPEAYHTNKK